MAPHYDQIGEYGLGQVLTKRLTTPGGAVAPSVAPELFPVMTLESDRPEWGYLKGEVLCGLYYNRVAVAGQYSILQLYLPSTAQTIITVTSVRALLNTGATLNRLVGIGGGLGGFAAVAATTRDFRWGGDRTSGIFEQTTNAALPARFTPFAFFNTVGQVYDEPIIITPGTALGISATGVNTALAFEVNWRERGAQPGELT